MAEPVATPAAPEPIWAVSPDGTIGILDPSQAGRFLDEYGYRLATPEEAVRGIQAQALDHPVVAAGLGAVSTLTFGASDLALRAAGAQETARAIEEASPAATVAGKVGGAILPALVPGVGAATAPVLIGKAGQAARAGVAARVGAGLAGRTAARFTQGAVEGALYGAGDVASRAFLDDPGLTAEKALGEIGVAGFLGGSLAAGAGSVGDALGAAVRKGQDAAVRAVHKGAGESPSLQLVLSEEHRPTVIRLDQEIRQQAAASGQRSVVSVAEVLPKARPETARYLLEHADELADAERRIPGITNDLVKGTPEDVARILGARDKIIGGVLNRIDAGEQLTGSVTDTYQELDAALTRTHRGVRPAEVARLTAGADVKAAKAQYDALWDDVEALAQKLRAERDLFEQGTARKIELLSEGMVRDASADPVTIYERLNKAKQQLDDLISYSRRGPVSNQARWTEAEIQPLRHRLRLALEDEKVWGEAGARQRDFNRASHLYRTAETAITEGPAHQKLMQPVQVEGGRWTYEGNPRQVNAWINAMADARGGARTSNFRDYLARGYELAEQMERSGLEGAGELKAMIQARARQFAELEEKAAVTHLAKALKGGEIVSSGPYIPSTSAGAAERILEGAIPTAGQVVTTGVKSAVEHVPGGSMVTAVLKVPRPSPSFMVGALDALSKITRRAESIIPRHVAGVFEAAGGVGAAEAAGAVVGRVTAENYGQISGALAQHAHDPEAAAGTFAAATSSLRDHAPEVSTAMQMAAARAVAHLAAKLPKPPDAAPLDAPYKPSQAELATFNRHWEAAQRPVDVLRRVAAGTVTPEHMETLQTVYPRLLAEMQAQALDRLASELAAGKQVPYRVKLSLAGFLGQDLDSGSVAMARNQAALASARQAEQAQQAQNAQALTLAARSRPETTKRES